MKRGLWILILLLALGVPALAQNPSGPTITLKAAFGGVCCTPGQLVWAEGRQFRTPNDDLGAHSFSVVGTLPGGETRRFQVNYVDTHRLWFTIPGNVAKPTTITISGPGFGEVISLAGNVPAPSIRNEGYFRHPFSPNVVGERFTDTITLPDGPLFVFSLTIFGAGFGNARDWNVRVEGPVSDTVPARAFPFGQPFGTEHLVLLLPRLPSGTYQITASESGTPANQTNAITVVIP